MSTQEMSRKNARDIVWWGGFVRGLPEQYQEDVANEVTIPLTPAMYKLAVEGAERAILIAGLDKPE